MDMVWYLSPQETQHGIHTSFSWLMRESETMAKILCVLMVVYHAIMRFGIWECAYIIHFRSLKLFFFFFLGKCFCFILSGVYQQTATAAHSGPQEDGQAATKLR